VSEPILRLCRLSYSGPSPSPEIGPVAAGRASVWPASAGLQLILSYSEGVSERKPAINQGPHQIQNQAIIKHMWVLGLEYSCLSCSLGFSLVLDPRGRLGGKVGSLCEEF